MQASRRNECGCGSLPAECQPEPEQPTCKQSRAAREREVLEPAATQVVTLTDRGSTLGQELLPQGLYSLLGYSRRRNQVVSEKLPTVYELTKLPEGALLSKHR